MSRFSRTPNPETQKYALLGIAFGLLFPIVATLLQVSVAGLPYTLASISSVQSQNPLLWIIDTAPVFLGLFVALAGWQQDRLLKLNSELKQRESELEAARVNLEHHVEVRTQELTLANQQISQRAEQLELIASVAKSIISIQEVENLLSKITQTISSGFGFYHVGVFMLDENKQYAILSASNSDGGLQMLKHGHRLKVGEQGIVGYVAQSGTPRIALDVGQDVTYFNNPDLPDTHSELALPLKSGEAIIGVLDIQSKVANAFSKDDVATLSILADQVAIAIQNAFSYEQSHQALRDAEISTQQSTQQLWSGYVQHLQTKGYRYDGVKSEGLRETKPQVEDRGVLLIPVSLRGQTVGRLKIKLADPSRHWSEDEQAIIEATADRVALALDGARLLDEAQKRASRETLLSSIGAKLGASFQLDSILRDTVEELGLALKGSTVSFQLVNPSAPPTLNEHSGHDQSEHTRKPE